MYMKTVLFVILQDYADWEAASLAAAINKTDGCSVVSTIINAMDKGGYEATLAVLMYDFVWCLIEGILLIFAYQYLTAELKDGTPFTEGGAIMVKNLGIKMIVLPRAGAGKAVTEGCPARLFI